MKKEMKNEQAKKSYATPQMRFVQLRRQTNLLQESNCPPGDYCGPLE